MSRPLTEAAQAEAALAEVRRAIDQGGRTSENYLRAARILAALRRWQEVDAALDAARAAADGARAWASVGDFYVMRERYAEAEAAYDEAVRGAPANARYIFNRAAVRRFRGDLDAAERDYDQVISLDPGDAEAWHNRSQLRTQSANSNHIRELERLLQHGVDSWRREVPLRFALAKEYEDLDDPQRSWEHLAVGAALRRRHLEYDVTKDLQTVDWIIQAFPLSRQPLPEDSGCRSAAPIFVVGMPRSGTSLVERIITGHPDVYGAGELVDFAAALVAAVGGKAGRDALSRRELVAMSAGLNFTALGSDYIERTRPRTAGHARFTDKMPLNYLYCGLIARALPNARILHVTRHPLASVYAVFKTLFNQGYPFSYELGETAEYYIGYRRLMDHWRRALPEHILDVSYEHLVAEPQTEGRRIFEYLGLDWQTRFTDVHDRMAVSTTASAAQVRQPIYRTSIDLWKRYAAQLTPAAERFQAAGIAAR